MLMQQLSCDISTDRPCVASALNKAELTEQPAVAIELCDGSVVTGKTSSLLGASAAALLNALKHLAGIDDATDILPHHVLAPIQKIKTENLGNHNPRLHTDEILIALAVSAADSPLSAKAIAELPRLRDSEVHSTVILSQVDTNTFRKLGMNLTSEPRYQTKKLFHT